jgi:hypothetical protein
VQVASTETGSNGTFGFSHGQQCELVPGDENYADHVNCYGYGALGPGTFTLRFEDDQDSYYSAGVEYASVYFGNVAAEQEAPVPSGVSTLTLEESDVEVANASMTRIPLDTSSGLYGKLADDTGAGHRGRLHLFDSRGDRVGVLETRRDGTWAMPVTALAPGAYKMSAGAGDLVSGWVGGTSFKTARTYTVPVKGATNAGSVSLARYAQLSGKITVSGVKGVDSGDTGVTVWTVKGRPVDGASADSKGNFTTMLAPGTYVVSAGGQAYDSFDQSDAVVSRQPLIERFWKTSWTMAGATRIVVKAGAKLTGYNFALSDQLVAATAPRITGKASVGKTLTASAGVWNETERVTYKYVWKRGSTVVSTKSTYKVTAKDKAKKLTVTVTAVDSSGTYRSGTATASVTVPKKG